MIFRAFMAAIVLANVFFLTQVVQIARARAMLDDVPKTFSLGAADADVTVTEFLEYGCAPCQAADGVVREAIRRDGHVRLIARPLPGQHNDQGKVKFAYAAGRQDKFNAANDLLLGDFRALDDKRSETLAQQLGLDMKEFKNDLSDIRVQRRVNQNIWLFRNFYGSSVPFFVVNNKIVYRPQGTPAVSDFLKLFNEARTGS